MKPETVQIYITAGALGRHAGVYSNNRCWAAHPTDDATAAFRAAVKFWFGKGTNAAWLYKNVTRVSIRQNTDKTWQATLSAPEQLELPKVPRKAPAPAPSSPTAEQLHKCPACGRAGFTKRGLAAHKCKPTGKARAK